MPNIKQRDRDTDRPPLVVGVGLVTDRGAGEHDAEQEQHHHGADVDQDLRDGDELGRGEDVLGGDATEHDDQPQRGVDDVLGRDDPERTRRASPQR